MGRFVRFSVSVCVSLACCYISVLCVIGSAVLGGIITAASSWQSVFFTSAVVLATIALAAYFVLRFDPTEVRPVAAVIC